MLLIRSRCSSRSWIFEVIFQYQESSIGFDRHYTRYDVKYQVKSLLATNLHEISGRDV